MGNKNRKKLIIKRKIFQIIRIYEKLFYFIRYPAVSFIISRYTFSKFFLYIFFRIFTILERYVFYIYISHPPEPQIEFCIKILSFNIYIIDSVKINTDKYYIYFEIRNISIHCDFAVSNFLIQ